MIYDALFSAVSNLFNLYVCNRSLRLFLRPGHASVALRFTVYGLTWFLNWIAFYILENSWFTTATMVIGLLTAAILFYESRFVPCLFSTVMTVALGRITEDIIWRILHEFPGVQYEEALGSIFSSLLFMFIILTVERMKSFHTDAHFKNMIYLNLLFITFGSAVISDILVNGRYPDRNMCLIGLSLICLIDIGTFYIYEKIYTAGNERIKNIVLEKQVKMFARQMEIYKTSRKDLVELQHDLKNHIGLLQSYLSGGKIEKAILYLEQLEKRSTAPEQYLKSGNDTVDSILNYMLHRAEALHCKTTVNILVPRDSFMNDFDLNIILSNLLDNALEALEKESERFLDIKMIYDKNVLSIHISNSFHGKIKTRLGRIQSSKKDKTLHGMGLSHVHRVVQSYGGDLHYSALDGRFTVEIILYPVTAPSLAK